jgi:hypothetical protein
MQLDCSSGLWLADNLMARGRFKSARGQTSMIREFGISETVEGAGRVLVVEGRKAL